MNDALNEQWEFLVHLEALARWKNNLGSASEAMRNDLLQLRESMEKLNELVCEAIIWES